MLRHALSTSDTRNPAFTELVRGEREHNLAWGERAAREMRAAGPEAWTYVALLGGADTLAFRVRVAQSHLRSDMLPSYWSEAILVKLNDASLRGAEALYVPLAQPDGPHYAPQHNGVVSRPLADFDDTERYPNIALIALPVAQEKVLRQVDVFRRSRSTLDALEHVLRWLAFGWGVARTPNPLHESYGVPSACMLEIVCAAESFDLTPGLESRASCPEAIWSMARYWQEYFKKTAPKGRVPFGRFAIGHQYPILETPPEPSATRVAKPARVAKAAPTKKKRKR